MSFYRIFNGNAYVLYVASYYMKGHLWNNMNAPSQNTLFMNWGHFKFFYITYKTIVIDERYRLWSCPAPSFSRGTNALSLGIKLFPSGTPIPRLKLRAGHDHDRLRLLYVDECEWSEDREDFPTWWQNRRGEKAKIIYYQIWLVLVASIDFHYQPTLYRARYLAS